MASTSMDTHVLLDRLRLGMVASLLEARHYWGAKTHAVDLAEQVARGRRVPDDDRLAREAFARATQDLGITPANPLTGTLRTAIFAPLEAGASGMCEHGA